MLDPYKALKTHPEQAVKYYYKHGRPEQLKGAAQEYGRLLSKVNKGIIKFALLMILIVGILAFTASRSGGTDPKQQEMTEVSNGKRIRLVTLLAIVSAIHISLMMYKFKRDLQKGGN